MIKNLNRGGAMFNEMVEWAVDEGADLIMGETFYYAEEAYKALEVIKKSGLPAVINIAQWQKILCVMASQLLIHAKN